MKHSNPEQARGFRSLRSLNYYLLKIKIVSIFGATSESKNKLKPFTMRTTVYCLVLILIQTGILATAQVQVYSYPDTVVSHPTFGINCRSKIYAVKVIQGENTKTSFVMYDKNHILTGEISKLPHNHWTNFSFDGEVTVEIERLDGSTITTCDVFPRKKGFSATINGNKATIQIAKQEDPLQLYVQINGLHKDPLFLFCDPPETDVPNRNDANTVVINTTDDIATVHSKLKGPQKYVVFEEGVHQWNHSVQYVSGGNKPGSFLVTEAYRMPLVSNKKIYIPGGAYVVGSFDNGSASCNNTKIYGRGVISGCGLEVIAGTTGIPYSMVHISSGTRDTIQGIISTNPPHFHATVRSSYSFIDNLKMFAWWYSTDGTVTGDNSKVVNSFFKLNDDAIKLYGQRCFHKNNTMYHQVNGAPFQFSWGNQQGDFNEVYDTYIVNSMKRGAGCKGEMNSAIINSRTGTGSNVWDGNIFDGIYIDNGCQYLIGLNANGGTFKNMLIKNVELNGGYMGVPQEACSYFQNGTFQNISIECLTVDGRAIDKTGTTDSGNQLKYSTFGTVTGAPAFSSCSTPVSQSAFTDIKAIPTPFSQHLHFLGNIENASFKLINIRGQVVKSGKLQPDMYFGDIAVGFYLIHITTNQNVPVILKVVRE
jgi:hypothetical protein